MRLWQDNDNEKFNKLIIKIVGEMLPYGSHKEHGVIDAIFITI